MSSAGTVREPEAWLDLGTIRYAFRQTLILSSLRQSNECVQRRK